MTLFATIMTDTEEKKNLRGEKLSDITGLLKFMQKFEFLFGLKLSILLYKTVDYHAKNLMGDDANISVAVGIVKQLVTKLENHRDDYDTFWHEYFKKELQLTCQRE